MSGSDARFKLVHLLRTSVYSREAEQFGLTAGRRAPTAEPFVCADGNEVSVQASKYHYCSPRGNDAPWSHVEVHFNTLYDAPPDSWSRYAETWSDADTDEKLRCRQFAYVPVELVDEYLHQHNTLWSHVVGFFRSI